MSKFQSKKIMPRYTFITILMTMVAIAVIGKTLYVMTAKRDYWMAVADRQKKDSVSVKPMRGNILSSDEQLMASSPNISLIWTSTLCARLRTTRYGR